MWEEHVLWSQAKSLLHLEQVIYPLLALVSSSGKTGLIMETSPAGTHKN